MLFFDAKCPIFSDKSKSITFPFKMGKNNDFAGQTKRDGEYHLLPLSEDKYCSQDIL